MKTEINSNFILDNNNSGNNKVEFDEKKFSANLKLKNFKKPGQPIQIDLSEYLEAGTKSVTSSSGFRAKKTNF